MNISLYGVAVYILVLFLLSAFVVKKALNSFEEYSYCGRSLSIGYIIFTYLGTWIGGGTIVGLIARTYSYGASQYWIIALSCVAECFFAAFFIAKIRKLQVGSIGSFFADRFPEYGEAVRIPVAIGLLIRNVTVVGMQFSALAYLITFLFGIDRNLSVLLVFLIITAYTVLSGLWGVVATDIFQGFLQTTGLLILAYITVKLGGGIHNIVDFYESAGMDSFLSLVSTELSLGQIVLYVFAFGAFFLMSDQANWERIYASRSDKTAIWGFIIPLVITLIMLVVIAYLGVFQRAVSESSVGSEYVIYQFIFERMNSKAAVFILIGIIAAIMSSADSFLLASGVIFSGDIVKRFINPNADDKELIFWTRVFVIITGAIGFAFAISISDLLFLWLSGIGLATVILIPGYFLAWFSKGVRAKGILLGMSVGLVYAAFMAAGLIAIEPKEICIGMLLNFLVSIYFRKPLSPLAS